MAVLPLPIDASIPDLREALARHSAAVVVAAPGAGKTTRVPPALADTGRVLVLQPRRVAARTIARRIAEEQGWQIGAEVGWHVRFDRRFTPSTRVLIVTEGMLTHYLNDDPLLSDVSTVVLDEFHERSLHTDLGLALVTEAWRARDDLRVVVMSATMDPAPVRAYLDDCPLVEAAGNGHPLAITYAPGESVAAALARVLGAGTADVLCFLPGAADIERALQDAAPLRERHGVDLLPLHGSLDADGQDRAISPAARRRVVFATNLAETSLTVPGVSIVVDTGLQKVARYDAERGIDTLVLERVTADSATQRAGRAARQGPGIVRRLWDSRDRLREAREPEIHRVDLAAVLLDLLAGGHRPDRFCWFEAPDGSRIDAARGLLARLGAIDGFAVTPLGDQLRRLPLHPRLGRVLISAGGAWEAAAACAWLSDGRGATTGGETTSCDLLPVLDRWSTAPAHTRQVADQLHRAAQALLGNQAHRRAGERELRRALLAGYPDRVARRRPSDRTRVLLSSGRGAVMGRESAVTGGEWMVALDLTSGRADTSEALVRMASLIEPDWLAATSRTVEHRLDEAQQTVKATAVERYDALTLSERPVAADPIERQRLLASAWRSRAPDEATVQLLRRARFIGRDLDVSALSDDAAVAARRIDDIDLASALPWELTRQLASGAPPRLAVPSGRDVTLTYNEDGTVTAAVKLQELFGLAETPRIGARREPVIFELLAPNGRPVQTTRDLRSFWERTYPEVRKELRGRYPRHPWPEDPWTATPTHRAVRRR